MADLNCSDIFGLISMVFLLGLSLWLLWDAVKPFKSAHKSGIESLIIEHLECQNEILNNIFIHQTLLFNGLLLLSKNSSLLVDTEKLKGKDGEPGEAENKEAPPLSQTESTPGTGGNAEKGGNRSDGDGNNS